MRHRPRIVDTRTADFSRYAWGRLRRFRNVEWVTERIMSIHSLSNKHRNNARKQANQISMCLQQAEQYFKAAESVDMLVRPLLVYYGIMSLGTAAILLLKDGTYRVEKIRENFGRHGLKLTVLSQERITPLDRLLIREDGIGVFQIFREAVGGDYAFVKNTVQSEQGYTAGFEPYFYEEERSYSAPLGLLDMADAISLYPDAHWHARKYSLSSKLVRVEIDVTLGVDGNENTRLIVHPDSPQKIDQVRDRIKFSASAYDNVSCTDFPSGFSINVLRKKGDNFDFQLSNIYRDSKGDLFFCTRDGPIRQVCLLYTIIFAFGTYSRYYPEMWARDITSGNELFLAAFDMTLIAEAMIPLFILQEMEFEMYHSQDVRR